MRLPAAIVHAQIPCASCCLNVHSPWNPLVTLVGRSLSLSLSIASICYAICISLSLSLCALISLSSSLSLSVRLCFVWHLLVYFRWRLLLSKVLLLVMCSTLWTANVWPLSTPSPFLLPYRAYARLHLSHSPLASWRPLVFAFWASVSVQFTRLLFLYFCFVSLRSIPFRFIQFTFVFTFLCAFILPFCVCVCVCECEWTHTSNFCTQVYLLFMVNNPRLLVYSSKNVFRCA